MEKARLCVGRITREGKMVEITWKHLLILNLGIAFIRQSDPN